MKEPKLRGNKPRRRGPHNLGQIPPSLLIELGRLIVHRLAIGLGDLTGDDTATIFAEAIKGVHRPKPFGVADVLWNGCAWSVKTVKANRPFSARFVRLISGRNSPDYSLGIHDPHDDPEATGRAVLSIWNSRVNESLGEHNELRTAVLIRNMQTREFVLFEEETHRFVPEDYSWDFNKRNNLEGCEVATGEHRFTWQPHGSQFTIIRTVPGSSRKFLIRPNIPMVGIDFVLNKVGFRAGWIEIG